MAEQLAAAHAEIKHLRATLEERDDTISQLRQEVRELSETVGLQAETLREQEAALNATVRVLASGRQTRRELTLLRASGPWVIAHLAASWGRVRSVCVASRRTPQ